MTLTKAEIAKLNKIIDEVDIKLSNTTTQLNNLIRESNDNPCNVETVNVLTKTPLNTLAGVHFKIIQKLCQLQLP